MPNALQAAIHQLAENFAKGVLEALRSASLDEIHDHAAAPARRGPGRPRKSVVADVAVVPAKRGRPAKPGRPSADTTVERILYFVRKSPNGLRSEELRARLGLEKVAFRQAAAKAVEAKLITKTGEKRATTFFPR